MLTPKDEHRLDGQCMRVYQSLVQLIRSLDDVDEVISAVDDPTEQPPPSPPVNGGGRSTAGAERVARLITTQERAVIRAQLVTWRETLEGRWHGAQ